MSERALSWSDGDELRRVIAGSTGMPVIEDNAVDILQDGDILPAMLQAIRAAHRSVDLMTYIWWGGAVSDEFVETLCARAEDGVRVRVLLDGVGARLLADDAVERMRAGGVQVEFFRPRWSWKLWQLNMRTHRRVLVCDDDVAFTGGVGIAQEWMGDGDSPAWRETHLRVRGPAVDAIHSGFYRDWIETPRTPVDGHDRFPVREPAGDVPVQVLLAGSQPGWNMVALAFRALIGAAQEHLQITTAYLRPPRHFRELLCRTAERGVRIDVLVPGPHAEPAIARPAAQHHYGELLRHGVRIWEYQPSMMHAKVITVDGSIGMVGTPNFDARSLTLNEQIAVILHDPGLAADLDARFVEDLRHSERIELDAWRRRGVATKARQWLAHAATFPLRGAAATKRGAVLGEPQPPRRHTGGAS